VYPPSETGTLKTWVAVGGSPESVVRAAHYGLPLMLAIIGGNPQRFTGYSDLYRQMLERFGKPMMPIGVHSPGHVAATTNKRRKSCGPHYAGLMNRIGAERGWQPIGRDHFEREAAHGALYVGSPETVAAKIVKTVKTLGLSRFRHEIQQRHAGARQVDEEHRAVRNEGGAARARSVEYHDQLST
jgi:alkanesulfonate monooxygenase SsuD/methylene tetrahydromethanopterin reductase-like flavin-dependent oxidoreductase (luciferase family)